MKAMARPCRLPPRTLLHSSASTHNRQEPPASPQPPQPSAHHKQDMDFLKAAEILFSEEQPGRRRKKFGWDFHLWQAFVACLPSVAIYLTAQYARSEIRRMEAEREVEEAEKRELEEKRIEESARSLPGFRTLHQRLDKLEEKMNEMQSKKVELAQEVQGSKPQNVQNVENTMKGGAAEKESNAKAPAIATQNVPVLKEEPKEHSEDSLKALNGNVLDKKLQEKSLKHDEESLKARNGKLEDKPLQKPPAEGEPDERKQPFKMHKDESPEK